MRAVYKFISKKTAKVVAENPKKNNYKLHSEVGLILIISPCFFFLHIVFLNSRLFCKDSEHVLLPAAGAEPVGFGSELKFSM